MSDLVVGDVLIVDDNKKVIEVLKAYCEDLGYFRNIIIARDGSEAAAKLTRQKFFLILLDVNMPKRSGVDLLSDFGKEDKNDLDSVIIISGELGKQTLGTAVQFGVKNFLVKPFDQETFDSKVKEVLKKLIIKQRKSA